jgi:hypothetical protein
MLLKMGNTIFKFLQRLELLQVLLNDIIDMSGREEEFRLHQRHAGIVFFIFEMTVIKVPCNQAFVPFADE